MNKGILYVIISFAFWLIAEYVTVWHSKLSEWFALMPWILLQYLFIVLLFWFLIFWIKILGVRLFAVMLAVMLAFELVWKTPFTPEIVIVLAVLWTILTFGPLWIVNQKKTN